MSAQPAQPSDARVTCYLEGYDPDDDGHAYDVAGKSLSEIAIGYVDQFHDGKSDAFHVIIEPVNHAAMDLGGWHSDEDATHFRMFEVRPVTLWDAREVATFNTIARIGNADGPMCFGSSSDCTSVAYGTTTGTPLTVNAPGVQMIATVPAAVSWIDAVCPPVMNVMYAPVLSRSTRLVVPAPSAQTSEIPPFPSSVTVWRVVLSVSLFCDLLSSIPASQFDTIARSPSASCPCLPTHRGSRTASA